MKHLIAVLFIVAFCGTSASAVTYQVGPTRTFHTLQDVAPLLAPGTLVFAALLALGAAYAHPALQTHNAST